MHPSQYSVEDTIVAAASTSGGLRGVVRLSGKAMWAVLEGLFGESMKPLQGKGPAFAISLDLPSQLLGPLPCRVHVWPTPSSYTRQLACELHVPGSSPVMDEVVGLACRAGRDWLNPVNSLCEPSWRGVWICCRPKASWPWWRPEPTRK